MASLVADRSPEPPLLPAIWAVAWPAMVTGLLSTLVFVADRLMLARYDQQALASMQVQGPVLWSLGSIFMGLCAGTLALVARHAGALAFARARTAARAAIRSSVALGLGVGAVGLLALEPILEFLAGDTPSVMALSRGYLRIAFSIALPAEFVAVTVAMVHYGHGDSRTPLLAGLAGNLTNIVLNAWLIFGLGSLEPLGVVGAAWATSIAFVVQAGLQLILLRDRAHPRARRVWAWLALPPTRSERRTLAALLGLGGPAMLERVVLHGGYLGFVHAITSLGAVSMAANQAVETLESVCFLSADGFGVAAGALVGRELGRGRPRRAQRAGLVTIGLAIAVLTTLGLMLWATAPWLVQFFVTETPGAAAMRTRALGVMPIVVLAQPFMATAVVAAQGLRGAGDTRSPMWAAFAGGLVLRVGIAQGLVALGWGLASIWWASTCDWMARAICLTLVFRRGRWARIRPRDPLPRGQAASG